VPIEGRTWPLTTTVLEEAKDASSGERPRRQACARLRGFLRKPLPLLHMLPSERQWPQDWKVKGKLTQVARLALGRIFLDSRAPAMRLRVALRDEFLHTEPKLCEQLLTSMSAFNDGDGDAGATVHDVGDQLCQGFAKFLNISIRTM
jgi:hypothetical protein